ncbi:MAG: TRAP transporter substrate-binding protein DctP [Alphaproteobacteria bacterium]|nr:TRAP transporter substrate-binding protein DctP [Alphaproteobacteria bacterium]
MFSGKRLLGRFLVAAIVVAPLIGSIVSPARAADVPRIDLRCNSVFPLASALSLAQIKWGEEVKRLSDGRITTENLANALYKGGEAPDALGGGLADCGGMNMYYRKIFPITSDSGSLPFAWTTEMFADWVNIPFVGEVLIEELAKANIRPLIGTTAAQSFFMVKPLPNGIAPKDMSKTFEGMRVRTWGIYGETVKLLGGTPVAMPAGDVPVALRQGLIDGFVTSWDTWKSLGMQNDSPYAYHLPTMAGSLFAINKTKWDSFPEDVRKLMLKAAVSVAKEVASEQAAFKEQIIKDAKANPKLHVFEATPDEVKRWRAAVAPIWAEFKSRSPKHKQYLEKMSIYLEEGYTPSWER